MPRKLCISPDSSDIWTTTRQRRCAVWTDGIGALGLLEFLRLGPLPLSGCQLAGLASSSGGLKWTDPWEREAGGPSSSDVGRSLESDIVD
jgi:hypothetical protein